MNKRKILYAVIVIICVVSVVIKAQIIKTKMARETSSISSEWKRNGIPVDVIKVIKKDLNLYTNVSGVYSNGILISEVEPDVKSDLKEEQPFFINYKGKILNGSVTFVAKNYNQLSGLYRVILKPVLLADNPVNDGDIIVASVLTGTKKAVLHLPSDSVFTDKNTNYCWKIKERKAFKSVVKTGKISEGKTEILSGLEENDFVVVSGRSNLVEGAFVMFHNNPENNL